MPRIPRNSDDPLQGQTFWSRRGGRDLSAEVDYNRPCPVCGYNLRGLPMRSRCPECGSTGGWNLYDEPVAWDETQSFRAFLSTAITAIFHPQRLARHVWCPIRMDLNAARKFRRICLWIASISLAIAGFVIATRAAGISVALATLPFSAIAAIVWVNAVTIEPLARMKDWSANTSVGRRIHAIVHYASATMALMPLHVVLVLCMNTQGDIFWPVVAGTHLLLLMIQLWIGAMSLGWLHYELVDMPAAQAHALALGPVLAAVASAVITLVAVPATVAMIAVHLLGQ